MIKQQSKRVTAYCLTGVLAVLTLVGPAVSASGAVQPPQPTASAAAAPPSSSAITIPPGKEASAPRETETYVRDFIPPKQDPMTACVQTGTEVLHNPTGAVQPSEIQAQNYGKDSYGAVAGRAATRQRVPVAGGSSIVMPSKASLASNGDSLGTKFGWEFGKNLAQQYHLSGAAAQGVSTPGLDKAQQALWLSCYGSMKNPGRYTS